MSTVTVAPTVEASNVPPRIKLDVTDVGTPNVFATTVLRLDPDGVQREVRTYDGNPLQLNTSGSNRVGLIYDYEAPFSTPVSYSTVESPTTVSAEVTVAVSSAWLIHPGVPSLSQPIVVQGVSERVRKVQRGVFYPMGRKYPVVQTDGQRKAPEYTLRVYSPDEDGRQEIEDLLDGSAVLLLNVPASKGWGIGAEYISAGDTSEERPVTFLGEQARVWALPVTVVDRPAGGTQAQRTLDDLSAFASLTALGAAYSTLNALAAGP